jgi:hypothetical protein
MNLKQLSIYKLVERITVHLYGRLMVSLLHGTEIVYKNEYAQIQSDWGKLSTVVGIFLHSEISILFFKRITLRGSEKVLI